MPVSGRPPAPRSRLRAALTMPLALLLTLLCLPGRAAAAESPVSGGRLDWGIKASFLSYVTGPVANGKWALTGSASTVGGSVFRFHSATGAYDPTTGRLSATFQGGARFTGHQENGGNALDLSISRLTVRSAEDGSAALYADVSSKSRQSGRTSSTEQARLADLSLAGVSLKGASGTVTLSQVPATLTSAGANAFGGFYTAGTALDPLTFSVTLKSAPPSTPPASSSSPSAPSSSTAPPAATSFSNGALDWGVRRTFRDYVTGSIAQGSWQPTDGAADGGAFFRWTPGHGTWDATTGTLDAAFTGAVHFTGLRQGDTLGLDLTFANPRLTVTHGQGRLLADVNGRTPDGSTRTSPATELATFPATALKAENGLLTATDLPLTLTTSGAQAFGSLYPAGTELDPLTFAIALDPTAPLPPLPDLGSPAPSPAPAAARTGNGGPSATLTLTALGALLAAATATTLIVRRRRH
ncbi:HtaA domain-containing protein [Kitasatospora sp. NPDC059673]|uniref:HtaA domain-containing protein n=1 Tax=Kitasatospora sp. NPDC059673 TaxID=3346901 RepID=UPI00367C5C70